MKTTEEDVILFWWPLILQECKKAYKGLEPEDRISEGALALLYIRHLFFSDGSMSRIVDTALRPLVVSGAITRTVSGPVNVPVIIPSKAESICHGVGSSYVMGTVPAT